MVKRRRSLTVAALVAIGLVVGWYYVAGHSTPKGQAPLTTLAENSWSSFKEEFNNSVDHVRLVVLLSPT
jgi:hypothetical protein